MRNSRTLAKIRADFWKFRRNLKWAGEPDPIRFVAHIKDFLVAIYLPDKTVMVVDMTDVHKYGGFYEQLKDVETFKRLLQPSVDRHGIAFDNMSMYELTVGQHVKEFPHITLPWKWNPAAKQRVSKSFILYVNGLNHGQECPDRYDKYVLDDAIRDALLQAWKER